MSGKREEILEAALAIADERGLSGLSMRAVAQAVGVTPMALYPHVKDKAGLLDAMLGRVLAQVYEAAPEMGQDVDWRKRLRAFAHTARSLSIGHPWVASLVFSRLYRHPGRGGHRRSPLLRTPRRGHPPGRGAAHGTAREHLRARLDRLGE